MTAKIIADSISEPKNIRLTTFEVEFPRIVLAEFNTHRVFSRNAASTRAIPLKRQIQLIRENMFVPKPFTKNQSGMTANEPADDQEVCREVWLQAAEQAIESVERLIESGVSKQHAGRLLEPFSYIKVVLTTTEISNFFELRAHSDASPEMQRLAFEIMEVYQESVPATLAPGDWHLPYLGDSGHLYNPTQAMLADALAVSASCCAQVSYRRLDDSLEKAHSLKQRLVGSRPRHSSPFEHQATPMTDAPVKVSRVGSFRMDDGVTHFDRNAEAWSGNFKGWIQYRQLIDQGFDVTK